MEELTFQTLSNVDPGIASASLYTYSLTEDVATYSPGENMCFSTDRNYIPVSKESSLITDAGGKEMQQEAPVTDDENSSSSSGPPSDPFAPECKIPLPIPLSPYEFWLEPTFIRKRNERERQRVRNVNDGFERLRTHLPLGKQYRDKRLSKVETLRIAINYIHHLQHVLRTNEPQVFHPTFD